MSCGSLPLRLPDFRLTATWNYPMPCQCPQDDKFLTNCHILVIFAVGKTNPAQYNVLQTTDRRRVQ